MKRGGIFPGKVCNKRGVGAAFPGNLRAESLEK